MDDQSRPIGADERERLKPRMQSHSLPVPPLIPIVAAVALILGISLGYGIAPRPGPLASAASADPTAAPTATGPDRLYVTATVPPDWLVIPIPTMQLSPTDEPPSGGITLDQALAAAKKGWPFLDTDVLSVTTVRRDAVLPGALPDQWLWAIGLRGNGGQFCSGPIPLDDSSFVPASGSSVSCGTFNLVIYVDYLTGEWVEANSSATYH
jgi:hypothetical protein